MSADCRFISILPSPLKSKWINKFVLLSSVAAAAAVVTVAARAVGGGGNVKVIRLSWQQRCEAGRAVFFFLFFNNMPLRAKYLGIFFVRHDQILPPLHFLMGLIETPQIAWSLYAGGGLVVHKICVFDPKSPIHTWRGADKSGMLMTVLIFVRAQTALSKITQKLWVSACNNVTIVIKKKIYGGVRLYAVFFFLKLIDQRCWLQLTKEGVKWRTCEWTEFRRFTRFISPRL